MLRIRSQIWSAAAMPSREAVERRSTPAADAARGRAALHWIAAAWP
jgi:hypothetical protein